MKPLSSGKMSDIYNTLSHFHNICANAMWIAIWIDRTGVHYRENGGIYAEMHTAA